MTKAGTWPGHHEPEMAEAGIGPASVSLFCLPSGRTRRSVPRSLAGAQRAQILLPEHDHTSRAGQQAVDGGGVAAEREAILGEVAGRELGSLHPIHRNE